MNRIFNLFFSLILSANIVAVSQPNSIFDTVLSKTKSGFNSASNYILGQESISSLTDNISSKVNSGLRMPANLLFGNTDLKKEDQELIKNICTKLNLDQEVKAYDMSFLGKFYWGLNNDGVVLNKPFSVYFPQELLDVLTLDEKEYLFTVRLLALKNKVKEWSFVNYFIANTISYLAYIKFLKKFEPAKNDYKARILFDFFKSNEALRQSMMENLSTIVKKESGKLSEDDDANMYEEFGVILGGNSLRKILGRQFSPYMEANIVSTEISYFDNKQLLEQMDNMAISLGCKPEAGLSLLNKINNFKINSKSSIQDLFINNKLIRFSKFIVIDMLLLFHMKMKMNEFLDYKLENNSKKDILKRFYFTIFNGIFGRNINYFVGCNSGRISNLMKKKDASLSIS